MPEGSPRGAMRGVGSVGSSIVLSQVLIAAAGVLAARSLGPSGRGIVAGVLIWGQTLPYFALAGVNSSLTVRIARDPAKELATALGSAVVYSLGAGVLILLPSLLIIPPTVASLGPHASELAMLTLALIPIGMLSEMLFAVLLSLGRLRHYNAWRLAGPVTVLIGTVLLAVTANITPTTIVCLTLVAASVTVVAIACNIPWSQFAFRSRVLRQDLAFGIKVAVSGWMGALSVRLDLMVMSTFVPAAQIGLYGVAVNAMMPVATIASAAAAIMTPAVARLGADTRAQISLIRVELRRYMWISILGGGALAVVAPFAVPLLFGSSFEPAVVLVWILIPGCIARALASMVTAGAIGMRRARVGNIVEGVSLAVTAVLLPVLLVRYEAVGAAITSTVAYAVAGALAVWMLARLQRSDDSGDTPSPILPDVLTEQRMAATPAWLPDAGSGPR